MVFVDKIIKILVDLGFSFWQVLIFIIIILYKNEITSIIRRVSSLKIGNNEIKMDNEENPDKKLIEQLKSIVNNKELDTSNISIIKQSISSAIDSSILNSIHFIRDNTTYLYNDVANGLYSDRKFVDTAIREVTFNKIRSSLNILEAEGLITLNVNKIKSYKSGNRLFYLKIKLSQKLKISGLWKPM